MSETIVCPHCNAKVEVEAAEPGSSVVCPTCEYFWRIPKPRKQLKESPKTRGMLISCPNCMKEFGVEDGSSGSDVNCPFCGCQLTINPNVSKPSAIPTYVAIFGIWLPFLYLAVTLWDLRKDLSKIGLMSEAGLFFNLFFGALWWVFISSLLWKGWKAFLACWELRLRYNRLNDEIRSLKSELKMEKPDTANKEVD